MSGREELRVFTYDISDNSRRRKIAALLEEKAARVQESVFEVRLSTYAADHLLEELDKLSGPGDSVRMYTISDQTLRKCKVTDGLPIEGGGRFWLL